GMSHEPVEQRPPAAADIQHMRAAARVRCSDVVIELAKLRFGEIARPVEQGAGIDHQRIQPELEELVAQIVVALDRFGRGTDMLLWGGRAGIASGHGCPALAISPWPARHSSHRRCSPRRGYRFRYAAAP